MRDSGRCHPFHVISLTTTEQPDLADENDTQHPVTFGSQMKNTVFSVNMPQIVHSVYFLFFSSLHESQI